MTKANKKSAPKDCPCHSGKRYAACCAPLHRGEAKAETPAQLMRSRYAGFALGLGDYLADTLASSHEDLRAHPRDVVVRALSQSREAQRFMGLVILDEGVDGDEGEVLFFAKLFEKGKNQSFVELSRFVREAGAWKYASGILVEHADLPADPTTLTRDTVRARADATTPG